MDVTNAIGKVYVSERSNVNRRNINVIIIRRTSAVEVTALLKYLRSEMKGVQEKTIMVVSVDRKIRIVWVLVVFRSYLEYSLGVTSISKLSWE